MSQQTVSMGVKEEKKVVRDPTKHNRPSHRSARFAGAEPPST
jgi:hypothetical protein